MISLFPCNVHSIRVREWKIVKNEVLSYIKSERRKDKIGVVKSNQHGWQSEPKYASFDYILLDIVKNEVCNNYLSGSRISKENVGMNICNLWININPKGAYNQRHVHPQSDMSGVWWIDIPKDSGKLWFHSPHEYDNFAEMESYSEAFKEKTETYPLYYMIPEDGMISLFSSNLHHSVDENKSNQERISISFNIILYPPDE